MIDCYFSWFKKDFKVDDVSIELFFYSLGIVDSIDCDRGSGERFKLKIGG